MESATSCEADSTEGLYVSYSDEGEDNEMSTSTDNKQNINAMWQPIRHDSFENWEVKYWNKLDSAMHKLLTLTPDQYKPLSYEELYTCVYKSVCLGYQEPLCEKLCNLVRKHLENIAITLERSSPEQYLTYTYECTNQYVRALKGIVPIFSYMDRFHVALKMKTGLEALLLHLYSETVLDKHIYKITHLLRASLNTPFHVQPPVAATLIKLIYDIDHKYVAADSDLFAKYLPNILPQTTVTDLPSIVDDTMRMQVEMINSGLERGDQSRKRRSEFDHLSLTPPRADKQ